MSRTTSTSRAPTVVQTITAKINAWDSLMTDLAPHIVQGAAVGECIHGA